MTIVSLVVGGGGGYIGAVVSPPSEVAATTLQYAVQNPVSLVESVQSNTVAQSKFSRQDTQSIYAAVAAGKTAARAPILDPGAVAESLATVDAELKSLVASRPGLMSGSILTLNRIDNKISGEEARVASGGLPLEEQEELQNTLDELEKVLEESTEPAQPPAAAPFVATRTPFVVATPTAVSNPPTIQPAPRERVRCNSGRWPVEVLSDPAAFRIPYPDSAPSTISDLVHMTVPRTDRNTARLGGIETSVFTVRGDLMTLAMENDLDLHLVIGDGTGATMIAAFPSDECQGLERSVQRGAMIEARQAITSACGASPTQTRLLHLSGSATITGVGFVDSRADVPGSAPNGVQLHPVLAVADVACKVTSTEAYHPSPND